MANEFLIPDGATDPVDAKTSGLQAFPPEPAGVCWDEDPLQYALAIIEAYQAEIRGALKGGKLPNGFCQGRIFLGAKAAILKKAERCGLKLTA